MVGDTTEIHIARHAARSERIGTMFLNPTRGLPAWELWRDAESDIVEDEAIQAPDADVIAFTEAFGVGDSETAWSYVSARCGGDSPLRDSYVRAVEG